jgi:hypothetical protein
MVNNGLFNRLLMVDKGVRMFRMIRIYSCIIVMLCLSMTLFFVSCGSKINNEQEDNGQAGERMSNAKYGLYGFINTKGEIVIEPQFKEALEFSEGLAPVETSEGWGYINKEGRIIITPQFLAALKFSEGLAAVQSKDNKLFGYIDKTGKYKIEPQYYNASSFSEGLARVTAEGGGTESPTAFIDKTGKYVITPDLEGLEFNAGNVDFHDDRALIINYLNTGAITYGYIDKNGRILIEPRFDEADHFSEGLAPVKLGSKWGYIDINGNMVIEPQFDAASIFSENVAKVSFFDGREGGYIDRNGNFVLRCQSGADFHEGLSLIVVDGKYGYMDKTGKVVIEPTFQDGGYFSEGLAPVVY